MTIPQSSRDLAADKIPEWRIALGAGPYDPVTIPWREMDTRERQFCLAYSRVALQYALREWIDIPEEMRGRIKNNLFRAARRATEILKG